MIARLPAPCWTVSEDGGTHYLAKAGAVGSAAARLASREPGDPVPAVTRLPAPCWTAYCDSAPGEDAEEGEGSDRGCERYYGDPEEETPFHDTDEAALRAAARADGWTFTRDGHALCPAHSRREIPGQLSFDHPDGQPPA